MTEQMQISDLFTLSSADLSADGRYRYSLTRIWSKGGRMLVYILLNPSVADALRNDPTVRVCVNRAKRLGYDGITVANLFAWRTTWPRDLIAARKHHDIIGPRNQAVLTELLTRHKDFICGWGDNGRLLDMDNWLIDTANEKKRELKVLSLTRAGNPRHPLRIPYVREPRLWHLDYDD